MAAGNTYVALASTTLGSAAADVTFSSISGAYTDLVLVVNATLTTSAANIQIQFNSDTATNYSWTTVEGNGTAASSNQDSSLTSGRINGYGYMDTTIGTWITSIQNYSNATTYKTYIGRGNNTNNGIAAIVGLWRSTAAINTIKLFPSASTFTSGSTFTLYGIAAA
jgi:hypothetical protein